MSARPAVLLAALVLAGPARAAEPVLGDRPEPRSPGAGEQVATDFPRFAVGNARGFDAGEATYTFEVTTAATGTPVASLTVPAGAGETAAVFPEPLLRGAVLSWRAVAQTPAGASTASEPRTFALPAADCLAASNPFGKTVVDWWLPACSLAHNHYTDPQQAVGPPDAGGSAPDSYFGMISLGFGGQVSLDLQTCAVDQPGDDVRVYQTVTGEPVTLYASNSPTGPWVLVEFRKYCGVKTPGLFSNHCDFDLASAGIQQARYLRVEDGELYPCPGDTPTEGADIDAVEALHHQP